MYNTIEVMTLKITSVQINVLKKEGFHSVSNENVKHTKVLPYLSIVQSVEGSYDIALGHGDTLQTGNGGFFIAPSNIQQTIVHHVNRESGKMSARWIFIDVEINKLFPIDRLYRFPVVVNDDLKNEMNTLFDRIFETDDIWQNYSDCYALIGHLVRIAAPITKKYSLNIKKVVTFIKNVIE